jgi:hypothetical protein
MWRSRSSHSSKYEAYTVCWHFDRADDEKEKETKRKEDRKKEKENQL